MGRKDCQHSEQKSAKDFKIRGGNEIVGGIELRFKEFGLRSEAI